MTAAARPASAIAPLCAGAALLAAGAIGVGFAAGATPEDHWQHAARYTARLSFLLFLPVFVASAWHRLAPSAASRFVLRRRRAFGLAFATAHGIHLGALSTFSLVSGKPPDVVTLFVGGGAYLALFALVVTSNDAAVRRLGRRWRQLHLFGVHYIWFVFTFSYAARVGSGRVAFLPLLAAALGALGLRIAAARARSAKRAPAAALA